MTRQIGQRVAYFRARSTDHEGRKLTAQAVANRCKEIGHPLDRAVIAKLEKGLRDTITVPELLVLARALDIPPMLLVMPVGVEDTLEVLPGFEAPPWDAAKWFAGERGFPLSWEEYNRLYGRGERDPETGLYERYEGPYVETPSGAAQEWELAAAPVILFRRHDALIGEWDDAQRVARHQVVTDTTREDTPSENLLALMSLRRGIEVRLRDTRAEMRRHGLMPPPLPTELEHLDGGRSAS